MTMSDQIKKEIDQALLEHKEGNEKEAINKLSKIAITLLNEVARLTEVITQITNKGLAALPPEVTKTLGGGNGFQVKKKA